MAQWVVEVTAIKPDGLLTHDVEERTDPPSCPLTSIHKNMSTVQTAMALFLHSNSKTGHVLMHRPRLVHTHRVLLAYDHIYSVSKCIENPFP